MISLRTKLILTFLLVALIPVGINGFLHSHSMHEQLTSEAKIRLMSSAVRVGARVDSFMNTRRNLVRSEAQLPVFSKYLQMRIKQETDVNDDAHMFETLQVLSYEDQANIFSYALLDQWGKSLASTNPATIGLDYSQQDYFVKTVQTGRAYLSEIKVTSDPISDSSLYFSAPIYDGSGDVIGVLVLRYRAQILQHMIVEYNELAGTESFAMLLDDYHIRLAHGTNPSQLFKSVVPMASAQMETLQSKKRLPIKPLADLATNEPLFQQSLDTIATKPIFQTLMGTDQYFSAAVTLTSVPWSLVFTQPKENFLAPIKSESDNPLLLASIIAVMSILAAIAMVQLITNPITRLTKIVEKFSSGDLNVRALVKGTDEIGTLTAAFNTMALNLQERIADNLRAEEEVAERKHAEYTLAEAQRLAKIGNWHWSISLNKLTAYSKEYAHIHGVTIDEIPDRLKKQFELVVHPDDRDRVKRSFEQFDRDGVNYRIEYRINHPDGAVRHVLELGEAIFDDKGNAIEQFGTLQDITERKLIEAELRESQEHNRHLIEHSQALICTHDLDGTILSINPAASAALGHEPGYGVGDNLKTFIYPSARPMLSTYLQSIIRIGVDEGFMRMVTKSGEERIWSYRNTIYKPESSEPFVIGFAQDTTERWYAEKALKESEKRLQDFARSASDFFWEQDSQLRYTYFSDRYEEVTGIDPKQLLSKFENGSFISSGVDEKVKQDYLAKLETRQSFRDFIFSHTLEDGQIRWVSINGTAIFNDDQKFVGYRGTGSDITKMVETRQRFEDTIESLPIQFALFDRDDRLILANSRYREKYLDGIQDGITFEELYRLYMATHPLTEIIGREEDWLALRLAMHRTPSGSMDLKIADNDWSEIREKRNSDGSTLVMISDITNRKLTEQSLRDVEFQLKQAARTARLGSWHYDEIKQRYISISEEYARIFGCTIKEYLELYLNPLKEMELVHPEDRQAVIKDYKLTVDTEMDYRILLANGEVIHVREISKYIRDEMGGIIESVGTLQDITELKLVEQALRQSEERLEYRVEQRTQALTQEIGERKFAEKALEKSETRFKDYAETAADYFWEMDRNFRFTDLAGQYESVSGVHPSQVIGLTREQVWAKWVPDQVGKPPHVQYTQSLEAFDNIELKWNHPDGNVRTIAISGKPIFGSDGEFSGYRGSGRDITDTHALAKKLVYQASHDTLTGLINRREFELRLVKAIENAQIEKTTHALCYLDLDQFKIINDTCGHAAGDEMLRRLGALLQTQAGNEDTVARLGGDEFGVLMEHCTQQEAEQFAEKIRVMIEAFRFEWEERIFAIGVSIGLMPILNSTGSMTYVMRAADTACYAAKNQGRNRTVVYHPDNEMLSRLQSEMEWVSKINWALEHDRFQLFHQPIVPVANASDKIYYEILLRMKDKDGQMIAPGEFLAAAERYNLATRIDRWVVSSTLEWLGLHPEHVDSLYLCSINLSGSSLGEEEFSNFVKQQLLNCFVPAEKICFEITETAAISNLSAAIGFIDELKALGCKFALDDFGSGLSSFAYLKNIPVDLLKIDGMFVKDIDTNPTNFAMVKSIHEIGRVMGKKTIAEFVESDAILLKLREIGVNYAQGYGIGRPQPIG